MEVKLGGHSEKTRVNKNKIANFTEIARFAEIALFAKMLEIA